MELRHVKTSSNRKSKINHQYPSSPLLPTKSPEPLLSSKHFPIKTWLILCNDSRKLQKELTNFPQSGCCQLSIKAGAKFLVKALQEREGAIKPLGTYLYLMLPLFGVYLFSEDFYGADFLLCLKALRAQKNLFPRIVCMRSCQDNGQDFSFTEILVISLETVNSLN